MRYRFNLHTVRYSGRRNVSIIHAVSSFEYFILDSSKWSRFLFFSPLSLSLSLAFSDFRPPTSSSYPLGEIYHGVKFIFHFGSIKVQSDSATLSGASRAFNFFFDTFYPPFLLFLRDSPLSTRLSDNKKFSLSSNSYISYFPPFNFIISFSFYRAKQNGITSNELLLLENVASEPIYPT